jgi:hypothetical protein
VALASDLAKTAWILARFSPRLPELARAALIRTAPDGPALVEGRPPSGRVLVAAGAGSRPRHAGAAVPLRGSGRRGALPPGPRGVPEDQGQPAEPECPW